MRWREKGLNLNKNYRAVMGFKGLATVCANRLLKWHKLEEPALRSYSLRIYNNLAVNIQSVSYTYVKFIILPNVT